MKDKKMLKTLALSIPVVLIGLLIFLFVSFQNKKKKVEGLQNIPAFTVQDINENTITQQDIPEGNKVLVYFNLKCEYCQMEMEELSQINEEHKDVNWIMFTDKPLNEIKEFAQKYNLDKAENIRWCNDPKSEVYLKFAMTGIPYFLGYNSENKLVHRSTGATKIEKVLADFDGK